MGESQFLIRSPNSKGGKSLRPSKLGVAYGIFANFLPLSDGKKKPKKNTKCFFANIGTISSVKNTKFYPKKIVVGGLKASLDRHTTIGLII